MGLYLWIGCAGRSASHKITAFIQFDARSMEAEDVVDNELTQFTETGRSVRVLHLLHPAEA